MNPKRPTPAKGAPNVQSLAREKFLAMKDDPKYKDKVISFSFLRTETLILNGQNLAFEIGADVAGTLVRNATEQRLNRNDEFQAVGIHFGIKAVDTTKSHARSLIYSYPNPAVFVTDGTNFVSGDLEALWNGKMQIKTGNTVFVDALPMLPFREAPMWQLGTITDGGATIQVDPWNFDQGFHPLQGVLRLVGQETHEITTFIPEPSKIKIQNTNANMQNWAVLQFFGVLVKNANKM